MAKAESNATHRMVRVYCSTADTSSSKSLFARIRIDAAERMVDDGRARWVRRDAIQLTELISTVNAGQPTITDAECEINAGAYAGRGLRAAETLPVSHFENVRNKVAVWPEIFDEKAPLPGYHRSFNRRSLRSVTVMSHAELNYLSDVPVVFTGSDTRESNSHSPRQRMERGLGDKLLIQYYLDDEPESEPEIPLGYHEVDEGELETEGKAPRSSDSHA